MVGADGQHVSHAQGADRPAQVTPAVDFVAGHEGSADPALVRSLQQRPGQLRLSREHHLLGYPSQLTVLFVGRAFPGQVQRPADQRVATGCGEGQGDGDLAQRDPADGAGVLAGRADRADRGLLIGGLVHDQYRVPVIEPRNCPGRCRIQDLLVVPDRPGQQMLQPVRATVPGRLGDAPAVIVLQLHQQPVHHLAGGLPGLPAREAPRHLPEQVLRQDTRLVIRYRGCRFLIVCHDSS